MKLTEHFSDHEFAVSDTRPELAKQISFSERDMVKLYFIAKMALEPVRRRFGRPVKILSGKRSPELNTAINGEKHSMHLYLGHDECAVDFWIPGENMRGAFEWMRDNLQTIIGELLYYPDKNFIHYAPPSERKIGFVKVMS